MCDEDAGAALLIDQPEDLRRRAVGFDRAVAQSEHSTHVSRDLEVVPTSTHPRQEERAAMNLVRTFKAQSALLERRQADLARLREEYGATVASLAEARGEQERLAQEVHVLAAEIESLEARTAAARTREAVGDVVVSSSGYAEAQERLQKILIRTLAAWEPAGVMRVSGRRACARRAASPRHRAAPASVPVDRAAESRKMR